MKPQTTISIQLNQRKFLAYNFLFLSLAFCIALGQNYLKYGASPNYKPYRTITYLCISLLLFAPFLPLAITLAKKLLANYKQHYWAGAALLAFLSICVFYILSNACMHLFGYYEGWITEQYARSYLGREAIWHAIAILLCLAYARFYSKPRVNTNQLLIEASKGKTKMSIPAHTILWVETADHYLQLHTEKMMLLKRETLDNLSAKLAPDFVRIHRKYLVNSAAIAHFEKENRANFIVLTNGERLKVGRSFADQLKALNIHDK